MSLLFWIGLVFADSLSKIEIKIKQEVITVEIADEAHERAKGLMFRKKMPEDEGMLFVYKIEENRSFWMRNTYIPLSIAYLDKTGVIIHIADMNPLDESSVSSVHPAQYALEMNQGWFEKHQIMVGMRVDKLP
jgi:uncharacterized membrane protein (UPF0127 family)